MVSSATPRIWASVTSVDTFEAIRTKLDVRQFTPKRVGSEVKAKILEAARLTGSSMNSQHWRFILVQDRSNLETLARDSTTGSWVKGADFAVLVNIDPKVPGSTIDAGRAAQDMELAAWEQGVASGVYAGFKVQDLRKDFGIPEGLNPAMAVGFGYPAKKLLGKKNRKPLSEVAFSEKFGNPVSLG
jgi:nitroreductase